MAQVREILNNRHLVVPAKAGTQSRQAALDARLREHDSFQSILGGQG
jgi:hypothetical protein